jgi:hypothetical protein
MKQVKENAKKVSVELMSELNQVLDKYNLGNVHIESIRLKEGAYNPQNCRRVCQIWTDPNTGEKKMICRTICKNKIIV